MADQYELVADAMYALRMIVSGRSSKSVEAKVEELVSLLEDVARQLPPVSGIPQNELALEVARVSAAFIAFPTKALRPNRP